MEAPLQLMVSQDDYLKHSGLGFRVRVCHTGSFLVMM